jgi:hypothetical protein
MTENNEFSKIWGYTSMVTKMIIAESGFDDIRYEINSTPDKYSTGRIKYECVFYNGEKLYSIHDAMELTSKAGNNYYVVKYTPFVRNISNSGKRFTDIRYMSIEELQKLKWTKKTNNSLRWFNL